MAFHRRAYTWVAPCYDKLLESATLEARRESLARLDPARDREVLICGAGSGLDIPRSPPARR